MARNATTLLLAGGRDTLGLVQVKDFHGVLVVAKGGNEDAPRFTATPKWSSRPYTFGIDIVCTSLNRPV